jgi:phosphoribosyl 1,2-cyclic phosphate phosphodiesterase
MGRELKLTILGSGSSTGVPRIGHYWGACDPEEPKNWRRRASLLIEIGEPGCEATTVLIDTSPDMRMQLLDAGTKRLDAVAYTHDHADQVHGIDDLRQVAALMKKRIPIHADTRTLKALRDRFRYCFETPPGTLYHPIVDAFELPADGRLVIDGPGGPLKLQAVELDHGIPAQGYVIEGSVGYSPDVVEIPEPAFGALQGLKCWVCDALQWKQHATHTHVDKTLGWFERFSTQMGVLTNLHFSLDYKSLKDYVPSHVDVAYDGMELTFQVP